MLMQISGISIWLLARVIRAISNKAVAQLSHDKAKCEFILLWKEVEVSFFFNVVSRTVSLNPCLAYKIRR